MRYEVIMPKLSLTMVEGTIIKWYKSCGDTVAKGEVLLEVMTDKINMEVEAPFSGVLKEILLPEGESIEVIKPIAVIEGEEGQEDFGVSFTEGNEAAEERPQRANACGSERQDELRIAASPAARAFARQNNIDLGKIVGTGPNGRIILENVVNLKRNMPRMTPAARKIGEENAVDMSSIATAKKIYKKDVMELLDSKYKASSEESLTGIQRTMAKRMTESWTKIPHVTLNMEIDMEHVVRLKKVIYEELHTKVSYTDIFIKASSMGIEEFPAINSSLVDDRIIKYHDINIGVAADTPMGLVVPVIRGTQRKTILEISSDAKDIIEKARNGKLSQRDITGGTFTVTNLGMFDIDSFTPIINSPEAAILGINRLRQGPVYSGGKVEFKPIVTLSLSFDHRIIDGATGAKFLKRVKFFLENPYFFGIDQS